MNTFATLELEGDSSGGRYMRAGSGVPVVVVQSDDTFGPKPFHDLLARNCEVTLAEPGALSAAGLSDLTRKLGYESCALLCDEGSSAACLDYAIANPGAVSRLVLKAPRFDGERDYGALSIPVMVLESSKVDDGHAGQQLAAAIPLCYHILVYDAEQTLSGDRPEAVAEVVGDFIERGPSFVISKPAGVIHP